MTPTPNRPPEPDPRDIVIAPHSNDLVAALHRWRALWQIWVEAPLDSSEAELAHDALESASSTLAAAWDSVVAGDPDVAEPPVDLDGPPSGPRTGLGFYRRGEPD